MDGYRWFERWNESLAAARAVGRADDGDDGRSARAGRRDTVGWCSPATVAIRRSCRQRSSTSLDGCQSGSLARDFCASAWRTRSLPPIGARSAVRRWWSPPPSIVPAWLSDSFMRHFDPDARVREIDRRREPAEGPRGAALSAMVDPWWTAMFEAHDPGATQRPVELRYPLFDVRFLTFALSLPTHPWCVNKTIARTCHAHAARRDPRASEVSAGLRTSSRCTGRGPFLRRSPPSKPYPSSRASWTSAGSGRRFAKTDC